MLLDEAFPEDVPDLTVVLRHIDSFIHAIQAGEVTEHGLPASPRWRPFEVGSSRWWWHLLVLFKPHTTL